MKNSILKLGTSLSRNELNNIYGGNIPGTCDCDVYTYGYACWLHAPSSCRESFECDPTLECEELP